jgi:tripartite-type tricarboxylate transporter receptor subunit TctC
LFNHLGKVNIVAIHYKGGGPGLVGAASGEVGVTFTNIVETTAYVKANRLRAIAVSSLKRSKVMPDLPSVAESGLPGYEFVAWHGMLAPKGTPRAVVTLLNERVRKAMTAPDQAKRYDDLGLDVVASTPEEFSAHLARELKKWGPVIRERGMRAE